jgi:chromosome partitioning protein
LGATSIAVLSQKGGTGKTTSVRTLTDVFRRIGLEVLAVDLDPQGNLSDYFDVDPEATPTIVDVLAGRAPAAEAIHGDIIPANLALAETELMLAGKMGRELTLRRALKPLKERYDLIILDCPPSLGLLTLNALTAATRVLVPLQCEYFALEGLTHLMATIDRVKNAFNPELGVEGVVLTMFDGRNSLTHQVADEVKAHFHVFDTIIPRNVKLSEAPSHGKPALLYDSQSKGAQGYLSLAREILDAAEGGNKKKTRSREATPRT